MAPAYARSGCSPSVTSGWAQPPWPSGTPPHVTTALWTYIALFSLSGIPGAALNVGLITTIQTTAPAVVLGRVTGVVLASEAIGASVGSILAGLLADHVRLSTLLNAQAATYIGCGLLIATTARRTRINHDGRELSRHAAF